MSTRFELLKEATELKFQPISVKDNCYDVLAKKGNIWYYVYTYKDEQTAREEIAKLLPIAA